MTIHQTLIRQAASPAEQRFLDLYADIGDRLPGASSPEVRVWRESALDAFARLGLPHRRIEEWKYTDLRQLMPEVYPLTGITPQAIPEVSVGAAIGAGLDALDAYRAVFVNGLFRPELSDLNGARDVSFRSFRDILSDGAVEATIAQLSVRDGDAVSMLSAGFATDGAMIDIAAGAKLGKPLHLIFIVAGETPVAVGLQNAIRLGDSAEATLVETHAAMLPSQSFAVNRIAVGAGAHLRHIRSVIGTGGKHLSSVEAELGPHAQYHPLQFTVGGPLTRAQSFIRFAGEGGRCHYGGAMMLRQREHSDFTLLVDHAAPGCESRELAKAVLDERGHGVFQAKVVVRRGAQKTDGKQMANALLLSDDAEFDSKPELEIYADDVVCGHGSTAGQLDSDLMFYLRARGIPEAEARALLISAFVGEALDKIEDEALRQALQEKVDAWLAR